MEEVHILEYLSGHSIDSLISLFQAGYTLEPPKQERGLSDPETIEYLARISRGEDNYKECTCDFCGAKEYIDQRRDRPDNWVIFRILGVKEYGRDACASCAERVENAIKAEELRIGQSLPTVIERNEEDK